jgi:hypothetical protein
MLTVKPKKDNDDPAGQAPQTEAHAEPPVEAPEDPQSEPQSEAKPEAHEGDSVVAKKEPLKKRKHKRHPVKSLLRILLALVIIAAGIYLILFVVAWLAKYDSIAAMLESMRVELDLMWQRIRN